MCHSGCLLGEVVGSLEISTEEPDFAVYIPLQEGSPVRPRELAMNRDGGRAGNGCHLPGPLTACFESSDGAMKNNEVGDPNRIAVAIAIDMLESLFSQLANRVCVKRTLEFSRQLDFVRLDHPDLNRPRFDSCGPAFPGEQRAGKKHGSHAQPDAWSQKGFH